LDWWVVEAAGRQIVKDRSNFDMNSDDWGLNNINLEEISEPMREHQDNK
tara:strand:+ start:763 stop:909 length:147 start_codon:yes stop_codon:yes gene_type:complete